VAVKECHTPGSKSFSLWELQPKDAGQIIGNVYKFPEDIPDKLNKKGDDSIYKGTQDSNTLKPRVNIVLTYTRDLFMVERVSGLSLLKFVRVSLGNDS
jgi:hypothetical protein